MGRCVKTDRRAVISCQRGVSVVEVLVAVVVLSLVFIGLMQAAILSIDHNMRNVLRDEAVTLASGAMEDARGRPFDSVVSDTTAISGADCPSSIATGTVMQMKIRDMTKDLCVRLTSADRTNPVTLEVVAKQIDVTVGWRWKGTDYTHSVTTLRRR